MAAKGMPQCVTSFLLTVEKNSSGDDLNHSM